MARVRKPDGEQTFAGSRGNDEVAPFPAIHRASMEPPSETFLAAQRIAGLPRKRLSAPDWDMPTLVHLNSLSRLFASFRLAVSKPSVNQP